MATEKITHEQVHQELDARFFLEYALFSGSFRHYVAASLEESFRSDPNDLHRRFFVLGLFREEHAAYEDMGAILEAFLRFHLGELQHPVEGVLRFKDNLVILDTLFSRRDIKSADDLYDALGLGKLIPSDWNSFYPGIDCEKALRRMCRFIFIDCKDNQKRHGISAYNKLKHGLTLVPYGKRYDSNLPDAPAVLIQNPQQNSPNPYALVAIPMDDSSLTERSRIVEFIQSTLRALAALYVIWRYPAEPKALKDVDNATQLFNVMPLIGVREFLHQLSERPEVGGPNAP